MENNTEAEKPLEIKGTLTYEIKFDEKGFSYSYSPQNDETNLIALLISEEAAKRAKINLERHLKDNKGDKKALDRLGWAGKTIKGLQIQIDAFIQMILYSRQGIDEIQMRQDQITGIVNELESKIQSGEIAGEQKSITTIQNPVKDL